MFRCRSPVAGLPGVECRSAPGGTHHVVFKFDQAATFTGAQVTGGGSVQSTSGSGTNEAVVNLQDVPNAQTIQITLQGVSDGQSTQNFTVPMSVLLGDTNQDRAVNSGDAQQTRNRSGQSAAAGNFRSDVNADGTVNAGDAFIIRAQSGTAVPSEAPPASN